MSHFIFGECDACGEKNRVLHFSVSYGIDTYACDECCGLGEGEVAEREAATDADLWERFAASFASLNEREG